MPDTPPTAEGDATRVLSRIVAAHRMKAVAARDRSPVLSAGFERALRHAAVPFKGLDLAPDQVAVREHVDLSDARGVLPQDGLIAVLEDGGGARGLIALSHGTVDALVEVQTTGRVDPRELPARPVTRIDEALCRDFIDLGLAAFSRETREVEDRDWPDRLSFGSRLADPGQLGLLLPDRPYHALSADVALGAEGARRGQVALILPRTRDPVPRAIAATGTTDPEAWRKALEQAVAEACVELDAVLVRTTRSLRDLEAMGPGDLIGFDASDLAQVRLETSSGTVVAHGRLGQIGGQRALRMATGQPGAGEGPSHAPDLPTGIAAMPPRPPDDMSPPPPDPMAVAAPPPDPDTPPPDPADAPPPDFAPEAAPLDFTPQTAPLDPDALLP